MVIAHEHRQPDISAKDGSYRTRYLWFKEHIITEPVLKDDGARSLGWVLVEIRECTPIYLVRHETFQHEKTFSAELQNLGIGQRGFTIKGSIFFIVSYHEQPHLLQRNVELLIRRWRNYLLLPSPVYYTRFALRVCK